MNKRTYLLVLGAIIFLNLLLFSTGSSILNINLFGIPFGNILIWVGLIALHLFFYKLNTNYESINTTIAKVIKALAKFFIFISIIWFGIAYLLSGNINFNFSSNASSYLGSPKASILFWNIIYTLVISPIILSAIYTILKFIDIRKRRKL